MRFVFRVIALLALLPALANAVPVFNVSNVNCSGALTSSFASLVSLDCTGNLSLDGGLLGGTLAADTQLSVSALGSLSLANLYLSAPSIMLTGNSVYFWGGVSFGAGSSTNINVSANGGPYPASPTPAAGTIIGNNGSLNGSLLSRSNIAGVTLSAGNFSVFPVSAGGALTLQNPRIGMNGGPYTVPAGGAITLGNVADVSANNLNSPVFSLSAGALTLQNPGIGAVASVPEPSIFETMLVGLLILAALARINRRRTA
ncbi:MAG TPA: hypothetical protein VFK88_02635 [Gallionella sp.]|nr:hypothetical protein [Gallionella sp.]